MKRLIALLLLLIITCMAANTFAAADPCDLDPFCDDPDYGEQVPLDNSLWMLLVAGTIYGVRVLGQQKERSPT
ncbi:hypothetical protein [Hufsiella ginkgonis]|uniref:Uncharacterized protein n=1 Tax=Hufsiella ginkgonis TaxID=2695274 RepID=A0A7K1XTA2_9SPHI|nr:hypothetical protein [Hufsiella ginkgonis]MXV14235.1 hypothetical protein [Hufsiella ginkgonis]